MKHKLPKKLSGAVTISTRTKKAKCIFFLKSYDKPRFLVTDNLVSQFSQKYPSLAFSDFQRPCALKSLSDVPKCHAEVAPPEHKLCNP